MKAMMAGSQFAKAVAAATRAISRFAEAIRNAPDTDLNSAQRLTLQMLEGGNSLRDYKAPHAPRGTPPRRKRREGATLLPRLFTGHRP